MHTFFCTYKFQSVPNSYFTDYRNGHTSMLSVALSWQIFCLSWTKSQPKYFENIKLRIRNICNKMFKQSTATIRYSEIWQMEIVKKQTSTKIQYYHFKSEFIIPHILFLTHQSSTCKLQGINTISAAIFLLQIFEVPEWHVLQQNKWR
jgi:hypothetical protein